MKRIKFGILDAVIIIAILVCAAGIYVRYDLSRRLEYRQNTVNAQVSFLVQNISENSADSFIEGAEVRSKDNDNIIGILTGSVTVQPAEILTYLFNGEIALNYSSNRRIDVRGVISAQGMMTDEGFCYNGTTYIAPGQWVLIRTQNIEVNILITNIAIEE